MRSALRVAIFIVGTGIGCACVLAQAPGKLPSPDTGVTEAIPAPPPGSNPVILDWTPPALAQLSAQAQAKSSFSLDRSTLSAAAGLISGSDDETRQAIDKLDGVSVHLLRFGAAGITSPAQVDAIRQAYHLRGWKHMVTTSSAGGPVHNGRTDVWLVLDGSNVRGAVVLVESPRNLTLVTIAGNLSPVDLLHLRGHFGIPLFDGDGLLKSRDN
jgi:hypothetical protein